MEVNDFIGFTAQLLSQELSEEARNYHTLVLYKELIRQNRIEAEKAGIGRETQLTPPEPTEGEWHVFDEP